MTTAMLQELSSYFNNMDPEDPVYQKDLIRPAEIKEDVKLMEQRKRVSNIMRSKLFKKDLENIFRLNHADDEAEGECTSNLSLADISEQLLRSALPKNKIANLYQLNQKKGIMCINDLHCGLSSPYEQQERLCRCKLVSVFRLTDMYGWSSGFNGTMTARPFRDREQILINPFGLMPHEITASSLLSLDFKGNILDFGSTVLEAHPTNWMIHSAIYSSRTEIRAIIHLKTPAAVAVSSLQTGLLPLSSEAMILGTVLILQRLPEIEQQSKITHIILSDLKNYLSALLTQKSKVLILPNNGVLICGETIEEAWHLLMNCQQACDTQLKLGHLSVDDLFIPSQLVQDNIFNQWRSTDLGGVKKSGDTEEDFHAQCRIGELEFEALMRHLDNNGYRSGYFYHRENIYHDDLSTKSERHKPKYEVEIPPSCISVVSSTSKQFDDNAAQSKDESRTNRLSLRLKTEKWFNTPNSFKLIDDSGPDSVNNLPFNFADSQSERKSTKWVSTKEYKFSAPIPQHPVNAGAYVAFGTDTSRSDIVKDKIQPHINPKELKENQKRVKNKYYHDTNTAGPISCLLDSGLSWDEARRLNNVTLQKQLGPGASSDQIVTAASKAVIQRGHKAIVYQDLYKPSNPFENVTTDELDSYHKEIDRKLNPNRYHDDSLKEEAPEIRIVSSQSDALMRQHSSQEDMGTRRTTEMSYPFANDNGQHCPIIASSVPQNVDGECHPFFQSDFDEDFKNLKLSPIDRSSVSEVQLTVSDNSESVAFPKIDFPKESIKNQKSFGSFSLKRLIRSKSVKDDVELPVKKGATLAAPGYGTITSETSGADISHDEGDKEGKPKKKKGKFKFLSFSKKKKDKSSKN